MNDGVEHRFTNLGKYNGQTRKEYLQRVSEDYGVPLKTVMLLADTLGSDEDHDALLTHVDELVDWNY
jgi:hypothetical protein